MSPLCDSSEIIDNWLVDGRTAVLRRATLDDFSVIEDLHQRSSMDTRYARYRTTRSGITRAEFEKFMSPRSLTLLASISDLPHSVIAIVNIVGTSTANIAEIGIMVHDDWQGRRIGTQMLKYACDMACGLGYGGLLFSVHRSNAKMISAVKSLHGKVCDFDGMEVDYLVSLSSPKSNSEEV